MNSWVNDKLLPVVMRFSNTKVISSMKNGLIYTMPLTIVGSIFLLLSNFPVPAVSEFFLKTGWTVRFAQVTGATFDLMALISVFAIAYQWVKEDGFQGLPAGILGMVAYVITLTPIKQIMNTSGNKVIATATGVIDKAWTGGKGMIAAIILGAIVGWIYSWFLKRDIRIKLPDQVPANVAGAFTALIPAAVIMTFAFCIYLFFDGLFHMTMVDAIYRVIQTPLQGLTDNAGGLFVNIFLISFLWAFGIHGPIVVGGILGPLVTANTLENVKLFQEGGQAALEAHGHIFVSPLIDQFVTVTGSGVTIGLVIFMLFFAKSRIFKDLGKLALGPAIFNINEPLLFGIPIVLNPLLIPPFIITPLVTGMLTYVAIWLKILPVLSGVAVPWTTPAIISGLIIGGANGWKFMLWQILMLVLSCVIWFPFARIQDRQNLAMEQGQDPKKVAEDIAEAKETATTHEAAN
ncbi:PTS sugar transporter subunit IIC [Schleiferilactobacillus perolens]|jgi:PTS system cellobiose-specific IIC component|uniref:PTS sugar transporter subunit IIC n=1 Tax=Schleiferilactobacillus perolens TaxID=100468 RepID=UPI0023542715|nr:PTS sugar transporter subunit IIC [Schleiferilactobacillus perolens]MCI2170005.1 PTS sugar transporter subunit IIC [Schleiferilactobacillus perolens]